MASITAQAPDGASLNVEIPEGTDPKMYDAVADDAVQHYTSTLQSPVESAARGALRNFPLGQQAAAAVAPLNPFSEKGNYTDELQHLTDAAEQGKEQNPKSYYSGAAAGTLAPLAIPGVGEALEAAPIAGNAALGAAQGISDDNAVTHPGQAAENAAIGGGIGGIMGALGKYFAGKAAPAVEKAAAATGGAAPLAESVAPVAKEAEAAIPQVVKDAASAAVPSPRIPSPRPAGPTNLGGMAVPNHTVAADFTPSADRIYASNLAQGFGGTPRQLMKVFGKKDPVQSLVGIGKWMETAGEGGSPINRLLDRPGELLDRVNGINKSAGKTIGDIIDDLGNQSAINQTQLLEELKSFAKSTADPDTEARILKLVKTAKNNFKKGIPDFDNLQQIKSMAGEQIAKDPEMSRVYGHLADTVSEAVNKYGEMVKNPGIAKVYEKAKGDFFNSSRILPILRYAEAKDLTGGPAGHHTLRGLLSSIFNMASAVTGLPPGEQLAKNAMLKAAPISRDVVNAATQASAAVAPKAAQATSSPATSAPAAATGAMGLLPKAAQMELTNYLQSKFGKKGTP